tara:strand:- start:313 stop:585 length:273 start_codon:yes stop_codon:yes gene_type:complete
MVKRYHTIEPDGYGQVSVYEWGIYERSSVLAGQQKKSRVDGFETVAQALVAYPKADVMGGKVSANNTVDHLPDREMTAWEEEHYWHPNDY